MSQQTKKNHIAFLPALALFAFTCFIRYSRSYMSTYYTTLFALSYDYGFIPQGFLGTFYKQLSMHLPWEMQNYIAVFNFSGLFTILYFLLLFLFYGVALHYCKEENRRNLQHFIIFLSIFAFPMFMSSTNFGSVYLYFCIITLLSTILILWGKLEILIIPLGIIGMCIHEDFFFLNGGLILLLLLYKILFSEKNWQKFKCAFVLVAFLVSTLYLLYYFENLSQYVGDSELIVEEIKTNAKLLSKSGLTYNPVIIKHDILGLDRTPLDAPYMNYNAQDFPIFCVLFAPYIFYALRFFVRLIKCTDASRSKRIWYILAFFGGLLMLPLFINKTEFGVYIFNLCFYYIGILIFGLAVNESAMNTVFDGIKMELKQITPLHFVWLLYPFIITPFKGVTISTQIHDLAEIIFTELSFYLPMQ